MPENQNIIRPISETDTAALQPLDTYPLVEDRGGNIPESYAETPARSSTVVTLLIVAFLLVSYCYRKGSGYFLRLLKDIWSVKRTENHLDEHTANEMLIMASLIAITVIMEGIVAYSIAGTQHPALMTGSISDNIALPIAAMGGFYLFQLLSVRLTGYIFSEKTETRIWTQGFNASQAVLGLLLTPVALVLLFAPQHNELMIFIAIILYFITRLVFWLKSVRLFYSNIFQYFYFMLYLCTVEVTPLIFLYKGLMSIP